MNIDLIFVFFVLTLMISRWMLPSKYMGFLYPVYGVAFIGYYSLSALLLWLIISSGLILFCLTEKRLIRIAVILVVLASSIRLFVDNIIVISFPYEFVMFLVCNLARGWALYRHVYVTKYSNFSLSEILSFLWFPPLLCGGPLETFQEFREYHASPQSISPLIVAGYFLSSILTGVLRDFIRGIWSPSVFVHNEATLAQFGVYFVMTSILLFLHFISWIHFVRAVCHLLGYPFHQANCGNFLFGGGLVEFWSRWNLSVTNFARGHLIYPISRIPTTLETSIRIFICFSIVGFLFNFSVYTFLWGLLQGLAIMIQIAFHEICLKNRILAKCKNKIPKGLKIAIVLVWIFITTPLLSPDAPIVYERFSSQCLELLIQLKNLN